MKKAVAAVNGRIPSAVISPPREELVRIASEKTVRHCVGLIVTKSKLADLYSLSNRDATELVRIMTANSTLQEIPKVPPAARPYWVDRRTPEEKKEEEYPKGWSELKYRVCAIPTPPAVSATSVTETQSQKDARFRLEKLYARYGKGVCKRCNGPMPGKGQHNRARRGHSEETCNSQMMEYLLHS